MKPWNEKQFKYEELFKKLDNFEEDKNKVEVSKALIILIALCKDVEKYKEKERFWSQMSSNILEVEKAVMNYFQK